MSDAIAIPVINLLSGAQIVEITDTIARQIVALSAVPAFEANTLDRLASIEAHCNRMLELTKMGLQNKDSLKNIRSVLESEPFLGEAHRSELEKAHTPVDAGGEDVAAASIDALRQIPGMIIAYSTAKAQYDNIRSGKVPGIVDATVLSDERGLLAGQYAEIAALRARLADAERRADEMEGKAGEWIAVDVHKQRVQAAVGPLSVAVKAMQQERDRALADLAAANAIIGNACGTDYKKTVDALRAEVTAERERRETDYRRLNNEIEKEAGEAWQAEKDRDAARAEVAALKARKVKLPDRAGSESRLDYGDFKRGFNAGLDACADAIRAAGVDCE